VVACGADWAAAGAEFSTEVAADCVGLAGCAEQAAANSATSKKQQPDQTEIFFIIIKLLCIQRRIPANSLRLSDFIKRDSV
jgi:hypothetical protein